MSDNALEVIDLCKSFEVANTTVNILKNINLEVKKGEFLSIMGPSGCGKSTLLYLLGGLDDPSSGIVKIKGQDINKLSDNKRSIMRRRDIGFVFQFYNLVQNLSVEENILLPAIMDGKKRRDCEDDLNELLDIIQMSHKRKVTPRELSGGQQQRVAIARALINSPEILLADEPIGNLDYKSGIEIMNLFKNINVQKGKTIIQVTHSESSSLYGTNVIYMNDGQVVDKSDKSNIYLRK